MLMGAALLVGADLIAKNLFSPLEMPVGVWTTIIGGPLLVVMMRRQLAGSKAMR
jgi:iron complex transport system permease protein